MRAALRRPASHDEAPLRLPCFCTADATHLGFKFFSNWMLPSSLTADELATRPWAHNYHTSATGTVAAADAAADAPGDALRSTRALDVFASLGATFILVERAQPSAAYVSMHKSKASGAWHCERENCLADNATLAVDAGACRDYVAWHNAGAAALGVQLRRLGVAPSVHVVFEECVNDQAACLRRVTDALGVPPLPDAAQPPRRSVETLRKLIPGYDDFIKRCNAA
jgi:LPS sulfotransferase NodH